MMPPGETWCCLRVPVSEKNSSETVWKSEGGRSMTYAPEHEKELLDRSHRRRMGASGTPCSASQQARTTANSQHPRDPQRYLLCFEERLPVAAFASRLRTPWETVYWWFRRWRIDGTFERLNAALRGRYVGATRALTGTVEEKSPAKRRDSRLPVVQDHRGGWRTERIRRGQEGPGQEATPASGH